MDSTTLTEKDNEVSMMNIQSGGDDKMEGHTHTPIQKHDVYRLIAKLVMVVNGDLKDMDLVKFFASFMG